MLAEKTAKPSLKVVYEGRKRSSSAGQKLFQQEPSKGKVAEENDVALVLCVEEELSLVESSRLIGSSSVTRVAPRASPRVGRALRHLLIDKLTACRCSKAVPLTHLNIVTSLRNIVGTYDLSNSDRGFLVMPL